MKITPYKQLTLQYIEGHFCDTIRGYRWVKHGPIYRAGFGLPITKEEFPKYHEYTNIKYEERYMVIHERHVKIVEE